MSLDDPVVITCSISGAIANRDQCPAIPYTPEEYAAEARRIVDEGGIMIHIHARTPDGAPSYEIEDFQAITEAINAEVGTDAIINFSTGAIGSRWRSGSRTWRRCRPEVAALNMGSMNYAKYSRARKDFVVQVRLREPVRRDHRRCCEAMNELGIKPEHECFDAGHVAIARAADRHGRAHGSPPTSSFVMGVARRHPCRPRATSRRWPTTCRRAPTGA